jgi:hypothetical protein
MHADITNTKIYTKGQTFHMCMGDRAHTLMILRWSGLQLGWASPTWSSDEPSATFQMIGPVLRSLIVENVLFQGHIIDAGDNLIIVSRLYLKGAKY